MKYAIIISPNNREINLKKIEPLTSDNNENFFSFTSSIAFVDDFPIFNFPMLNEQGKQSNKKFFLCTDSDIVEVEGIAIIPIPNKTIAPTLIDKLKDMIEWQN
ncbi:hypothetical protein [Nitrosophilus labii]|uniref:hypothetical protein n=1 Tax=Nitrosophilus labii TaxID=2706014 RepID=UPI001656BF10|nr:hypothetical protein [Nitrosophilus labii]